MTELVWFSIGMWSVIAVYLLGRLSGRHRHQWSPWADMRLTKQYDYGKTRLTVSAQERRCTTCGKKQFQEVA